jgi:[ribosomal protein S5]-alanine N-acetyltransferase
MVQVMRNYFLRSARLGFGIWSAEDLPLALGLWGDPEVTKLTGGPFSPAQVRERLSREVANQERHEIQYWPIFLLQTGEHAGCCGLQPRAPNTGVFELGFQLRKTFWAQGLGREAAEAVIARAFTTLGISALYAGHHPKNVGSRRLLEKLGFRYTHDEFYPPTGQVEPCYLLRNDNWPQTPRRDRL